MAAPAARSGGALPVRDHLRFGRRRGDRDFARLRLLAHTCGRTHLGLLRRLIRGLPTLLAIVRPALTPILLLVLLRRLVHRIQDAEIVLRMLEIALGHHAITAARRVAPELQILLEQLLRGATNPQIGAAAVEHMVAIERNPAAASSTVVPQATTTAAATGSMAASTHTFHVHTVAV